MKIWTIHSEESNYHKLVTKGNVCQPSPNGLRDGHSPLSPVKLISGHPAFPRYGLHRLHLLVDAGQSESIALYRIKIQAAYVCNYHPANSTQEYED